MPLRVYPSVSTAPAERCFDRLSTERGERERRAAL
jgi:hypothetical protein